MNLVKSVRKSYEVSKIVPQGGIQYRISRTTLTAELDNCSQLFTHTSPKTRWWPGIVVSALASINEVNQRRARLVLVGDRIRVQFPARDIYLGM